jgi:hypothetical protein
MSKVSAPTIAQILANSPVPKDLDGIARTPIMQQEVTSSIPAGMTNAWAELKPFKAEMLSASVLKPPKWHITK